MCEAMKMNLLSEEKQQPKYEGYNLKKKNHVTDEE